MQLLHQNTLEIERELERELELSLHINPKSETHDNYCIPTIVFRRD